MLDSDPLAGLPIDDAVAACESERYGDWFRDPWGWPELAFCRSDDARPALSDAAREPDRVRLAEIDVPKSNFGVRPAVVLPPALRVVYQSAALAVARRTTLPPSWVFGWRLRNDGAPRPTRNQDEWTAYLVAAAQALEGSPACLQTDITSFFASVETDRVVDGCFEAHGSGNATHFLGRWLPAFQAGPRRSGLPQRSTASALLANSYLAPLDAMLTGRIAGGALAGAVRWMDDTWLFGSEANVRQAQVALQDWLRQLGLEMNMGKTALLVGAEREHAIEEEQLNEGAVPDQVDPNPQASAGPPTQPRAVSPDRARELEDRLLAAPQHAPRSLTKYVLKSLRVHGEFARISDWLEQAPRLPHVADAVARYVHSARWADFPDWLSTYIAGDWDFIPWSTAQLATAVPSDRAVPALKSTFAEWMIGDDLPKVAVGLARMMAWHPDEARATIRELAGVEPDPAVQRLYLHGLVSMGEERAFVRSCAAQHSESQLTAALFEARGYVPLAVTPDFAAR